MGVSSANLSGRPAPTTCDQAVEQLGEAVSVYLDGGTSGDPVPSTIVDVTGDRVRVVRQGAVSFEDLREVVPDLIAAGDGYGDQS
jgi:tRNA A37 threonylcarbamoyladenosine synthetase subunit TsaC/SUA5/YrdC